MWQIRMEQERQEEERQQEEMRQEIALRYVEDEVVRGDLSSVGSQPSLELWTEDICLILKTEKFLFNDTEGVGD